MKRMFSKYDGAIVDTEHFDDEIEYICNLISKIDNKKEYAKILVYISNIENITEIKDNTGKNLLMCACDSNNLDLIKYFLRRGININSTDNDNDNILYYVDYARNNALEILDFLIKNGVNVFHKNNKGVDIFIFLHYINNITPFKNVRESIQYLLDWYGKTYVRNNFIKDPNFVTNIKSVALFGDVFIETILQFIDIHIITKLQKLLIDIESLLKKFSKKDVSTLKTNLEESSVIELLRYSMPSELTEKLIDNLIIKEDDNFKRKMLNSLVLCNQLLKIAEDKRNEIYIMLKTKESNLATESLLLESKFEESKKFEDEEKNRIKKEKKKRKKEKERENKERKIAEKFEKESMPRELKLMGDEDTRLYYDKMSYVLAEKRIEELLTELKNLSLREKLDTKSKNRLERIINRRERERKERERFLIGSKQKLIIHLDEEDYEDTDKILQEELQRELEKDDETLLILEEIYAQQRIELGFKL